MTPDADSPAPLTTEERTALYTARWHVTEGQSVPTGAPREALLGAIAARLGEPVPADRLGGGFQPWSGPRSEGAITVPPGEWLAGPGGHFPVVGRALRRSDLPRYLAGLKDAEMKWKPSLVVIHHSAAPSLVQRPVGWQHQHMANLRDYYVGRGWHKGPHLFVDEDEVWAFSPLTHPGTHAVSYNASGIGLEMLGDFDSEYPHAGRGAEVLRTALLATAYVLDRFDLGESAIRFHRDDPRTDKTCPGRRVDKVRFVEAVRRYRDAREYLW